MRHQLGHTKLPGLSLQVGKQWDSSADAEFREELEHTWKMAGSHV